MPDQVFPGHGEARGSETICSKYFCAETLRESYSALRLLLTAWTTPNRERRLAGAPMSIRSIRCTHGLNRERIELLCGAVA